MKPIETIVVSNTAAEQQTFSAQYREPKERGCGDNSCFYKRKRGGQGTNGGCTCDECLACGASIRGPRTHRSWCTPELRAAAAERAKAAP